MIGWLGFGAKVLDFVTSRAADRTITWSLDARRNAARALIRFYETLDASGMLLENLLEVFNEAVERKKPIMFSKELVPFENQIARLTEDAARQYDDLVAAIYLFDPQLARLLQRANTFKVFSWTMFGLLLRKARFTIEFDGLHPFRKVSFSTFRDEVANINLDEIIEAQRSALSEPSRGFRSIGVGKNKYTLVIQEPNKLVEALSTLLVEDEFTASDFEKVSYLRDRLQNQAKLLKKTLVRLRKFIASNFTMSDVLRYHQRTPTSRKVLADELKQALSARAPKR
jgi:hypothetical protein